MENSSFGNIYKKNNINQNIKNNQNNQNNQNPFNIQLNGTTKINNMKKYILYSFISNNNIDGIKLYPEYVSDFYNENNKNGQIKYTLNTKKIINDKKTLELINSNFYNLIDTKTINPQFNVDFNRSNIIIKNIKYQKELFDKQLNTILTTKIIQKILNNNTNLENTELENSQIANFRNKIINIIKLICTQTTMGYLWGLLTIYNSLLGAWSADTSHYNIIINDNQELLIEFESLFYGINLNSLSSINTNQNKINYTNEFKKINMIFNITLNNIEINFEKLSKNNASNFLKKHKNNKQVRNFVEKTKNDIPKQLKLTTIPVKKRRFNIDKNPEFLIISFNEEAQQYNFNDIQDIVKKIYEEKPKFIFVCTQESKSSGKEHFQHVLGEILKNRNKKNNIELLIQNMLKENKKNKLTKTTYNLLTKFNASGIISGNKNVRTRLYYESSIGLIKANKSPILNLNTEPIITNKNEENMTNTESLDKQPSLNYYIKSLETKKSTQSGLGSITEKTLYKGSIFTKLDIIKNNIPFKIIVINSHLFYKKNKNTGLDKRKKEFSDLIKEFNLVKLWKEGYNIFFCGDLNFRLFSYNANKNINYNEVSTKIINNYANNISIYKENFTNNHKENNELYTYLNNMYMSKDLNLNERNFYLELLSSIEIIGLHLTSKYFSERNNKNIKFYSQRYDIMNEHITIPDNLSSNNNTNNNNNQSVINKIKKKEIARKTELKIIPENTTIFNIRPKKNGLPRIPSMTDRILFCIADTNKNKPFYIPDINPANFNIHLTPDKSDHKMITLGFNLKLFSENNNINSNINSRSRVSSLTNNNRSSINSSLTNNNRLSINSQSSTVNLTKR